MDALILFASFYQLYFICCSFFNVVFYFVGLLSFCLLLCSFFAFLSLVLLHVFL